MSLLNGAWKKHSATGDLQEVKRLLYGKETRCVEPDWPGRELGWGSGSPGGQRVWIWGTTRGLPGLKGFAGAVVNPGLEPLRP